MPTPASDIFRQLAYKVESTYGTAPAASGAQLLRRVGSTLDLDKDTYQSNEVRTDYQIADYRHGVRRVAGQVSGELSAGTYKDFVAALLKRDFAAVTAITGASITIAGSGPTYTLTRGAGSWLSDGIKNGDVIRMLVDTHMGEIRWSRNDIEVAICDMGSLKREEVYPLVGLGYFGDEIDIL